MIVAVSQLATSKGDLESRLRQTAKKIQIQMTLLIVQHRGFRISSQVLKLQLGIRIYNIDQTRDKK